MRKNSRKPQPIVPTVEQRKKRATDQEDPAAELTKGIVTGSTGVPDMSSPMAIVGSMMTGGFGED